MPRSVPRPAPPSLLTTLPSEIIASLNASAPAVQAAPAPTTASAVDEANVEFPPNEQGVASVNEEMDTAEYDEGLTTTDYGDDYAEDAETAFNYDDISDTADDYDDAVAGVADEETYDATYDDYLDDAVEDADYINTEDYADDTVEIDVPLDIPLGK